MLFTQAMYLPLIYAQVLKVSNGYGEECIEYQNINNVKFVVLLHPVVNF